MPTVHVYIWPGRDAEGKRRIMAGITQVLADEGIPAHAVSVLIHEVPRENWGEGGAPATEWGP